MKILRRDGDHILIDSKSRPGRVAHTLEKTSDGWVCTCEAATKGGNRNCGHVRWIQEQEAKKRS